MSSKSLPINRKAVHCTGARGGWRVGPQPYSGERRGAVRAAAKLERKICIFCHPRPAPAPCLVIWLSGAASLMDIVRSPDTGDMETAWLETWLELSHQHNPHIQGVEYVWNVWALSTEEAIFTQFSKPLAGGGLVSPCAEIMRDWPAVRVPATSYRVPREFLHACSGWAALGRALGGEERPFKSYLYPATCTTPAPRPPPLHEADMSEYHSRKYQHRHSTVFVSIHSLE